MRKAISGPALIRLLARLTDADFPDSEPSLADRLGQWLLWTDAIALSAALGGGTRSLGESGALSRDHAEDAQDALCLRVRMSLTDAIARDAMLAPQRHRSPARNRQGLAAGDAAPDYAAFRQCYLSLQEKMESAIGNLRTLLRDMLAGRAPAMSRLASVDAVMERVLGIREHNAFAAVPGLLAAHFERLRDAELAVRAKEKSVEDVPHDAARDTPRPATRTAASPTVNDGPWLDMFRKDMQSVLFAELEIRFQPVEGLRAALRTR